MTKYNFTIPENLQNQRIDKALSLLCKKNVSRSQIQKAIKNQKLILNNKVSANLSEKVKVGDEIDLIIEEEVQTGLKAINIPLDIIYEDEDIIILNKSSSMTVHPGAGNYTDTLVNALLYHTKELSSASGDFRPGIVHRLDKNTSGLMVVAKNNFAHRELASQIKFRTLRRQYQALVWGVIKPQNGIINQSIARSTLDRKKMTTVKYGGKISLTHYKTLEILQNGIFSLVECRLETGRTHQIRVHLSHIGHSIVGDQIYGNNKRKIAMCPDNLKEKLAEFNHQALHSFYISFIHPTSGKTMEFNKTLPDDYSKLVSFLKCK